MHKHFNYHLFFLVAVMVVFSLIFLACLSAPGSMDRFGNTTHYLFHQLLYGFLPAIIAGVVAYKTPLHVIKKWAPLLVMLNLFALFVVFLPFIGLNFWGASRWISVGKATIQPSEFLKITSILYLSAWISSKLSDANTTNWKSAAKKNYHNIIFILLPFLVFLGIISVGMVFQRDASTLGIITLTLLAIYFSAKTPLWHSILIVAGGIGSLAILILLEPYRLARLLTVLNPSADPQGKGFQLTQSLISIGSGGIFGKGLGLSTQKFGYLPAAMSDSVFAIIGEELGLIGCMIVIAMFLYLFYLGIKISRDSHDRFSKMTAIGVVVWITLQAFINMSSSAGIFPLAGIPLPFFSYGGSHLVTELMGIGLLLNISKNG